MCATQSPRATLTASLPSAPRVKKFDPRMTKAKVKSLSPGQKIKIRVSVHDSKSSATTRCQVRCLWVAAVTTTSFTPSY